MSLHNFLLFHVRSHIKNSCFVFDQGFQTPRNNKTFGLRPRASLLSRCLEPLMKHSHSFLIYYFKTIFDQSLPLKSLEITGSPSSKYVVYAIACVYRELHGKIADRKKNCVNDYLIWNKVFLPQMCRELVSRADFKAILTPFSGVIWNRPRDLFV